MTHINPNRLMEILGQGPTDWQASLEFVMETMQEVSRHTRPAEMVRAYGRRMQDIFPSDRFIALSRRGLRNGEFLITRDSERAEKIDPWQQRHRLPRLTGGLLSDMLYQNQAVVINDLQVPPADPACSYLRESRSLMSLPVFDGGEALNMTILLSRQPGTFRQELLPIQVWTANLFGRATQNLVFARQLEEAHAIIDREMETIGQIQRSLLPRDLPPIRTLDLAAHYETARQAGGDYYDLFPIDGDQWGILVADVSGHGSPAAVLMAITHVLAHTRPRDHITAGQILGYVNRHLAQRYNTDHSAFVTAFFGVYDPDSRSMTYANAGHPAPRVKRCQDGTLFNLDAVGDVPLGILPQIEYHEARVDFVTGDQIIFYTDGITETFGENGQMFGHERLDDVLTDCRLDAAGLLQAVRDQINRFAAGNPPQDDRTLIVGKIR